MAGSFASSRSTLEAPLSSISRAVTVLPRASLGSEILNRSTRKRVVSWAVRASASARTVWRCAAPRWMSAYAARPLVSTMPAIAAHENANRRRLRRCCSRRLSESKPTPRSPEMSLRLALFLPSLPGRASAAIGSVRAVPSSPSGPRRKRSAGGKHSSSSRPGMSLAFGSPPTIKQKMRSSRPRRLNARISSLTHFDFAA